MESQKLVAGEEVSWDVPVVETPYARTQKQNIYTLELESF
jgi:hypothetical protein